VYCSCAALLLCARRGLALLHELRPPHRCQPRPRIIDDCPANLMLGEPTEPGTTVFITKRPPGGLPEQPSQLLYTATMAATAKPAVAFGRGPQQLVVRRRVKTPKAGAKPAPAAADKITHPSVAFLFDPERDAASAQPYWTLGDEAMETEAALRERAELRTHPAVQDAIRRLGNAAFARDAEGFIVQEEYERVHARIARVLAPGMPEADAAEAAAAEWQADAHGQDRIDDSRLNAALFQLVDLWCQTTQVEEYLSFLEALRFKLRFADVAPSTQQAAYNVLDSPQPAAGS
jgi:hypothetical protein